MELTEREQQVFDLLSQKKEIERIERTIVKKQEGLNHQDIAERLGISRERVRQITNSLKKKGALPKERRKNSLGRPIKK